MGWRLLLGCVALQRLACGQGVRDPDGSKVVPVPYDVQSCFGFADWYADVFGVMVVGSGVKKESVQHAADVLAGYLDNDQDGKCDDPKVCKELRTSVATLLMFKNSNAANDFWNTPMFFDSIRTQWYGNNMDLNGVSRLHLFEDDIEANSCAYGGTFRSYMTKCEQEFDYTLKATLRLITHFGVAKVYGSTFAENMGSTVGAYIQELNGDCGWGYTHDWIDPASGLCTGYFAYDDKSCSFGCLVKEGLYLAITSLLGAQDYKQQIYAIRNEWLLYSESLLSANAPEFYSLLTDTSTYPWLPTVLPNGTYYGKPKSFAPSLPNYGGYFCALIVFVMMCNGAIVLLLRYLRRKNIEGGFEDYDDDDEDRVRNLSHEMSTVSNDLTEEQKSLQIRQHEAERRMFEKEVVL